jgi:ParB-like chromosome segregation protein Spo0J
MNKLKIEYVDVEKIIPYQYNPRKNDKAVEFVMNSIKEFGFKVPMVITSGGGCNYGTY